MAVRPAHRLLVVALVLVALSTATLGSAEVATAATGRSSHLVTYRGDGVAVTRLSHGTRKLHGTSRAFRAFVVHRLDVLWAEAGRRRSCRHSALVLVKRYDGRFAEIDDEGWFAAAGDPDRCNGGGYRAIWKLRRGHWREVLAGQDEWTCRELRHRRVPRVMVPEGCYGVSGSLVPYVP